MPELTTKEALLERMVELTNLMKNNVQNMAPVGCVQAFAGSTNPDGWLLCDGSAVSRTTYAALFAVIGTTYGSGDGSTTFNLPDLVDKFIQGNATSGTVKAAGLPNITGKSTPADPTGSSSIASNNFGGALKQHTTGTVYKVSTNGTITSTYGLDFDASLSNSIYGNSTTVQPPALTMRYIIKY